MSLCQFVQIARSLEVSLIIIKFLVNSVQHKTFHTTDL